VIPSWELYFCEGLYGVGNQCDENFSIFFRVKEKTAFV
jgi:hypothetical protein